MAKRNGKENAKRSSGVSPRREMRTTYTKRRLTKTSRLTRKLKIKSNFLNFDQSKQIIRVCQANQSSKSKRVQNLNTRADGGIYLRTTYTPSKHKLLSKAQDVLKRVKKKLNNSDIPSYVSRRRRIHFLKI